MRFKDKLKLLFLLPVDLFRRIIYKKPLVMSDESTVQYIIENKCSIARFGDGELDLMLGIGIKFQKADKRLTLRLKEIAQSQENYCLVCIPNVFSKKHLKINMDDVSYTWWKHFLFFTKGYWYKIFRRGLHGDTNLSRFYMEVRNKQRTSEYVTELKKIWDNEKIVFVEGSKSRLGVGNDLFSNAASVKRIICPSCNAFDKYDEILDKVKSLTDKNDLIICALGPTATVLSYDLASSGRRALDLGHVDIEYEWYKLGVKEKVGIKNKSVTEVTDECGDEVCDSYVNQIISEIC